MANNNLFVNMTTGILELSQKRGGRLRTLNGTYQSSPDDPVVSDQLIEKFDLRPGLELAVQLGDPVGKAETTSSKENGNKRRGRNDRGRKGSRNRNKKQSKEPISAQARRVSEIETIDDKTPQDYVAARQRFEDKTTIAPQPRLTLEYPGCPPACRLIDLFCPIGYGQRGMIVSPPKAGKTILLQDIAYAIEKNHPEVEVIALLIDERPEEVTDFKRNVPCTVWASSNDHSPEKHVHLLTLAIDRAKRMAEQGKDVVVLLDSLTRVGRAFNVAPGIRGTGRTLSGGLDASALSIPKQAFGSARKFEEGGSLSIIATALVDTGSRGDQVIFEEFKGTGNMELILNRKIAEQRIFPAIDLAASGTRREELLLSKTEVATMSALRRRLLNMPPVMQVEQLLKAMNRFETNAELVGITQAPAR